MSEKTGIRKNWPKQLPASARLTASPLRLSNQLPTIDPKIEVVIPPSPAALRNP
jgi:hypothetical protein